MNEPNGLARVCVHQETSQPTSLAETIGIGGPMFGVSIVSRKIKCSFKVDNCMKINAENYLSLWGIQNTTKKMLS